MCNKAMSRKALKQSVEHKRLSSDSCGAMNDNRRLDGSANEDVDNEVDDKVRRSKNYEQ